MVGLTYDYAFKAFFFKNPQYLKRFLFSVLNLDIDYDKAEITLAELPKDMERKWACNKCCFMGFQKVFPLCTLILALTIS